MSTPQHHDPLHLARPVLSVEAFSKRYADLLAVDRLDFEVRAGEILGMVGPNGAGKTSTLRSIAGVLPIRDGRILIRGHDISLHETEAKSHLAWVPDNPQPFDSLTVWEHLEFTAALHRLRDWSDRALELLERFELGEKRHSLGGELSRGMRQKLAFCCAWLHQPSLLLMDEPLSGLDPRGIRSAREAIVDLAAEGTAVILSSHLLELVQALGHRVLIMDRGQRVFLGTLSEARTVAAAEESTSLEEVFLAITEGRAAQAILGTEQAAADWAARSRPAAESAGESAPGTQDWSSGAFEAPRSAPTERVLPEAQPSGDGQRRDDRQDPS